MSEAGRIGTIVATTLDNDRHTPRRIDVEYHVDGELTGKVKYHLEYDYILVSKAGHVALFIEDGKSGDGKKR